jgi:hydrogenase nickel incorporation protein HypA/HybF
MHELALSQSIVDLVVGCAQTEGMRTVTRVVVEIGVAAGVDPEALRFCFGIVADDTAARGAELAIIPVALGARCRKCLREFAPPRLMTPCPSCGAYGSDLVIGRELRVKSFDGEYEEVPNV